MDLSVLSHGSLVWNAVAKAVLLLLDNCENCEHLVEECAAVANALLERCPSALLLATSREPFAVEGGQVFRLPFLELPETDTDEACARAESVRPFRDRATAADVSFVLDAENMTTVAEVCRRLDGMPLAIELVASRLRHLPIAEIVRRLNNRFRLLTGARRDARQRQQTLQAAID